MAATEGVVFEFVTEVREEEIIELYRAAGWWKDDPAWRAQLGPMVRGSFLFLAALSEPGRRMVGMARVLSDGVSDAYIQDVTVLPAWRGRGIGRELVRRLTEHCAAQGLSWIGLVAEPGTQTFYGSIGYAPLVGYQPMRFDPVRRGGGGPVS